MNTYRTLDEAFQSEVATTLNEGALVSPRGMKTLERLVCTFRITYPQYRLILHPMRKWSIFYALGEWAWHMSASQDLDFIEYYSRAWRRLCANEQTVDGSCYGHRIFSPIVRGVSQWERCKRVLMCDPFTRRAIIPLSPPNADLDIENPDVSCTNVLQFLLRDGYLNLIAYMRSNDVILGFGYDVFLFTMLQELMAMQINAKLGWYQHVAGSLHIYEKDCALASEIAGTQTHTECSMPPMPDTAELPIVLEFEKKIRRGEVSHEESLPLLHPYWSQILYAFLYYSHKKRKNHSAMVGLAKHFENSYFQSFIQLDEHLQKSSIST